MGFMKKGFSSLPNNGITSLEKAKNDKNKHFWLNSKEKAPSAMQIAEKIDMVTV